MTREYKTCPNKSCGRKRPSWALGLTDCDKCRVENNRNNAGPVEKVTPNAIIATARQKLAATDWTQIPDVRRGKAAQYKPYREALRGIIDSIEDGKDPTKVKWPDNPKSLNLS